MNNFIKFSDFVKNRWKYVKYIARKKWKTTANIRYYLDYNNKNEYIEVPKWFEFDFNSCPVFFHWVVDRDEYAIALFHDYLYSVIWEVVIVDQNNLSSTFRELKKYWFWFSYSVTQKWEFLYNRKFADTIWLEWAIAETREIKRKEQKLKILLWYLWIRIGGGFKFRK